MRIIGNKNSFFAEVQDEAQLSVPIWFSRSDYTYEPVATADSVADAELIVNALNLPPRLKRDEVFGLAGRIIVSAMTQGIGKPSEEEIRIVAKVATDVAVAIQTEVDSRFTGGV